MAAATTILGVFLASTAGYAFSRFRFPGRRAGLMSFLVSQMFPGTLTLIPLYIIIVQWLRLGIDYVGLVLIYTMTAIPFCVWMLKGYFDTIPRGARGVGADRRRLAGGDLLPHRPAAGQAGGRRHRAVLFMTAWNEFILAATFMDKEAMYTGAGGPAVLRRRLFGAAVGIFRGRLDHRRDPGRDPVPVPAEVSWFPA